MNEQKNSMILNSQYMEIGSKISIKVDDGFYKYNGEVVDIIGNKIWFKDDKDGINKFFTCEKSKTNPKEFVSKYISEIIIKTSYEVEII